jgi:peptidoglycan/xylan/chitin deacetylase (PgdA/CDA1 family)
MAKLRLSSTWRWMAVCVLFAAPAIAHADPAQPQNMSVAAKQPVAGVGLSCRLDNGVFRSGPREDNRIALSFDVCPTSRMPAFAPEAVAFLQKEHVPATFFVSGQWARAHPQELKILADTPFFRIALHGDVHPHLMAGQSKVIEDEIEGGRAALIALGLHPEPLFRPPFGDAPPELSAVARKAGVLPVLWDAMLGDPGPKRTAALMERDALRWVQAGSIIILHANGGGYNTAQLVRELVPLLQQRGYVFVNVSDLVAACKIPTGGGS